MRVGVVSVGGNGRNCVVHGGDGRHWGAGYHWCGRNGAMRHHVGLRAGLLAVGVAGAVTRMHLFSLDLLFAIREEN